MSQRIIAHLDMDAFFASLEERANPHFKGKPIAVGADPRMGTGRGVVSTANYKAREYGIHSAMPISVAWRLSENAKKQGKEKVVFLPPNFTLYEESSRNILEFIEKYSDDVEQGSIDEFYFDLSSAKTFSKAEVICRKIKDEIREKGKITCSIGLGPNKLIAKIAAGMEKPDGLFVVSPEDAEAFLGPLSIRKIPGIGPKTAEILKGQGVVLVKDLKKISKEKLKELFGKWGEEMYFKVRGIDESPIIREREAKSIGEQITFQENTLNAVFIGEEFKKLCEGVFERFRKSEFDKFKTITITVRFADFETKTSSKTLTKEIGIRDEKDFKIGALRLILPFLDQRKNPRGKLIRLIGLRIEGF